MGIEMAAIAIGRYFNVPADSIRRSLEEYKPNINNFSQLVRTRSGYSDNFAEYQPISMNPPP